MSQKAADFKVGYITVIAGFGGTLIGGWLGDRLLRRWRESYLWVSAVSTLAAVPFAYLAMRPANETLWVEALWVAVVLVFLSNGLVNSSLLSVVPAARRASAMALSILIIHSLGDAPSPAILGHVADWTSVPTAALLIPIFLLLGGLIWLYAAWRGERAPRPAEGATM
ncbi:MAG TPA: hypothetical protein VMT93_03880 [Gemmatimonadaceae bacterium]|nr:hypothetical protein [Gemmatimonadaceae bacterium]